MTNQTAAPATETTNQTTANTAKEVTTMQKNPTAQSADQLLAVIAQLNATIKKQNARMDKMEQALPAKAPKAPKDTAKAAPKTEEKTLTARASETVSQIGSRAQSAAAGFWSGTNSVTDEVTLRARNAMNPTIDTAEQVIRFGIGTAGTAVSVGAAMANITLQGVEAVLPQANQATKTVLGGAIGIVESLFGSKK